MKKQIIRVIVAVCIFSGIFSLTGCNTVDNSDTTENVIQSTTSSTDKDDTESTGNTEQSTKSDSETEVQTTQPFDSTEETNSLNSFLANENLLYPVISSGSDILPVNYDNFKNKDGSYLGINTLESGISKYNYIVMKVRANADIKQYIADINEGSTYGSMDPLYFVTYDDFNSVYKKCFDEDYDISSGLTAIDFDEGYYNESEQAQNYTNENYVLVNCMFEGMNGISLDNTAISVSYNEDDGTYTAELNATLNKNSTFSTDYSAELKYRKSNDNIILISYVITENK